MIYTQMITEQDILPIALGAAILGSGGGGDPTTDARIARRQLELYGSVPLRNVDDLTADDLVLPVACMGAPLVGVEKLATGQEFHAILHEVERYYGRKPTVLMTPEIGGGNAFAPLMIAGLLGLCVLDADSLGRAFPELQMSSFYLHGVSPSPAFIADMFGNVITIHARDGMAVEKIARDITVSFGSTAHIAIYGMDGITAQKSVVRGSVSRARAIGQAIIDAQISNTDPIQAIVKVTDGICLGRGMITDINQRIHAGFLLGTVDVYNHITGDTIQIHYQNENFVAYRNGICVATTPDIIIPVDEKTGYAITSESLQYGLRVAVLALPCDVIWKTEKGLQLVGPRAFSADFDYQPFRS